MFSAKVQALVYFLMKSSLSESVHYEISFAKILFKVKSSIKEAYMLVDKVQVGLLLRLS